MRTHILAILCICISFSLSAQDNGTFNKNELKVNAFNIVLGAVELQYDYVLNEESSLGITATYVFANDSEWGWGLMPNYRLFFGRKPVAGLYTEMHAGVMKFNDLEWDWDPIAQESVYREGEDAAVCAGAGIAVGYKLVTKRNVVLDVFGGIGRSFVQTDWGVIYPRAGISLGRRF